MKQIQLASSGKKGEKISSDCFIEICKNDSKGIKINIESKVEVMYGNSIRKLVKDMIKFFELNNADIYINDFGALPFTLCARFENAVKRLFPDITKEYLLPLNTNNKYKSSKDKLRRSRLYLPGNEPKFYTNAGLHNPDAIILDLEDSVSPPEKDAAQLMVRNALRSVDFYKSERMVRINQLPRGIEDLKFIVPHNVHVILIPKCESAVHVKNVEREVEVLKELYNIKNDIYYMPIIESARGVINAFEIAAASDYNCALAVGLEDYTADIGTQRTNEGKESFYARSMVVNAAKAAGIQAIDTVFSDISDMAGLKASVIEAKNLGFEGKGCIHPRQIKVINETFAPTNDEIDKAKNIVLAFEDAQSKGMGVVALGSKMIDAPVVKRAQKVIESALLNNIISKNWRE
ncbi:MAG: HpcH/HpaI aldolase/citrate lyase family protein [Bacteroidetes bacterium]|nr:HpcH/HpaI aldolase/citrate lyase family protein [Bacteroidota bacterium]